MPKPRRPYRLFWRDIAWVVILKLALLFALAQFFFSPSHRPKVDGDIVSQHLFSTEGGDKR